MGSHRSSSPAAPGPTGSGTHPPLGYGCMLRSFCDAHPPCCFTFGLDVPQTPVGVPGSRWREDWSCCCRRIPQTAPKCLFLFEKILLLNPASPYKEGPDLSHSPPHHLDWGLSGSGPHTTQLSTLPFWCPQSPCVYHFVLIPLPATSSNQVSLSAAQASFGRGGSR